MTHLRLLLTAAVTLASATLATAQVPSELESSRFSGPDITPCPACLCVAATGEVYVGVDLNGSLGKGPEKGRIVRLVDNDHDGKADRHTVFAAVDDPRGLVAVGSKVYVLHTVIPKATGILEGMHLSVLEDADGDGIADGPPQRLISNISVPKHNQDRGADHTTNGIQLGIDGWIYVAVGDFGFVGAEGTDGTKITMLGGGVVRVRPDGTEFEVYTHGLRNIYDVAIDPFMNLFTRGNTNDGGGWNVRFIHHIQSAEYGYPVLFKHFTDEILPALVDLGGGSGTGALFFDEPGWPAKYTKVPMMCDWGRSQLFIHRVTPDGASFTQEPEDFIKLSQITDADVDGSGRLYLGAWDGAGYQGNPGKGFVERVVPKGWSFKPFPDLKKLGAKELVALLKSESAKARQAAQQEILTRPADALWRDVAALALDQSASLEARVAAIFTYKQMRGAEANEGLVALAADPAVREWALRCLTDRKTQLDGVPMDLLAAGLKDESPRVRAASAVALGRLGKTEAAEALLAVANPPAGNVSAAPEAAAPVFESKVITGKETVEVEADIEGLKEVYLVVENGGDGDGKDHAGWFDPILIAEDGKETPLTKMKWATASQGWGKTLKNKSCDGSPLADATGKAATGIGTHAASVIRFDTNKKAVKLRARVGLTASAEGQGSVKFLVASQVPGASGEPEGPHATPNSPVIIPHLAVRALVALEADAACLAAVGGPNSDGALWALRYRHTPEVVDGLLAEYNTASAGAEGESLRWQLLTTLVRLSRREADYDGSWWWSTRPDTRGPYYKPATWERSDAIDAFVKKQWEAADPPLRNRIAASLAKHRVEIPGIEATGTTLAKIKDEPKVDLSAIAMAKGEVGKMSIEDIILAVGTVKGDRAVGEKLFTQQGCVACHTTSKDQPLKGPFMGHVGSILSRDQIAESILKPSASISQGFATVLVTKKDKSTLVGFVSAESADGIEVRDITGQVHAVKAADIAGRQELPMSMMPEGLANALTIEQFASLLAYLQGMKE
jgi:putative heme-binding domain-containing protein